MVPNVPTPGGEILGEILADWADRALSAKPLGRQRCDDCAFRAFTTPNACPGTLMEALQCVIEKTPFYCHAAQDKERLCAGWQALTDKDAPLAMESWPMTSGGD